jgi:TRAP-type C4-dicarboxylate transport system permease small subunit
MNRLMNGIERVLALAFIAAVCLNFANVVGRYGFGRSIAAADEIQIYIMVFMAFLGAAVVSWRRQHLRMDVLVRFLPGAVRRGLGFLELALVIGVAGFALVQSWRYSAQMFALGRTSDVGGIPMWIPHGAVTLGFFLLLVASLKSRR